MNIKATIKESKKSSITLSFDGRDEYYDTVYDVYDKDLHPIGFCQKYGLNLSKANSNHELTFAQNVARLNTNFRTSKKLFMVELFDRNNVESSAF